MTEVELPHKSGVRPQQIAPYALEEQLAGAGDGCLVILSDGVPDVAGGVPAYHY